MSKKKYEDVRVVVGLDFGTTYSGYSYYQVEDKQDGQTEPKLHTDDQFPGRLGQYKTNTILHYCDETLDKVESWGYKASHEKKNLVELFKLHLGNLPPELRVKLPEGFSFKKAIVDYLREIGKWIEKTLKSRWNDIEFLENVFLIITVPAEYSERENTIMRKCAYDAGLINDEHSEMLQIITEPEAAAVCCMKEKLREHSLTASGTTFMIVDCGGGTVDLTTRKLLNDNQLSEITERAGDYCGSTFIDREFKNYLRREIGDNAIDLFEKNNPGRLRYMVQDFCDKAKIPFPGDDTNFTGYELDLEDETVLQNYVSDEVKEKLEENEWLIEFDYDTIKSMFDPVVERILRMIRTQLDNSREKCSIMFLVGGFSKSKYLQKRIKQEFRNRVDNISVPSDPEAAISRGAAIYGLNIYKVAEDDGVRPIISSRTLKFTYGIEVLDWDNSMCFHTVAKKGTEVKVDEEITTAKLVPCWSHQSIGKIKVYYTQSEEKKFCNDPGMKLLGKFIVDWPDVHLGLDRSLTFKLAFGKTEITATAINDMTGQNYQVRFEKNPEDEDEDESEDESEDEDEDEDEE